MSKNHDEKCNCCDQFNEDHDCYLDEHDTIYLTLDDDTEMECNILGIFEVEDNEYIALSPIENEQVFLYQYEEDEEGITLINIEDDEEFDIVSEAFYALFLEEDGYEDYEDYDDYEEFKDYYDEDDED